MFIFFLNSFNVYNYSSERCTGTVFMCLIQIISITLSYLCRKLHRKNNWKSNFMNFTVNLDAYNLNPMKMIQVNLLKKYCKFNIFVMAYFKNRKKQIFPFVRTFVSRAARLGNKLPANAVFSLSISNPPNPWITKSHQFSCPYPY